jgi:DNA-binding IclR family transcriptional regulator
LIEVKREKEMRQGMKNKGAKKQQGVQVLNRAISLLMELANFKREVELAELARRTGLNKSTSSRILSTMENWKLVRQNPITRRFSLGHVLIHLGNMASSQLFLPELFHFRLEKLMELTGETSSLVILDKDKAVYIDQVQPRSLIRSFPTVGSAVSLHCTAVGKVLLSGMSKEVLENLVRKGFLPALTTKTITDPKALLRQIEEIKLKGYAVDDEETEIGGRCIAAPVFNSKGEVIAAVGISGPSSRVSYDRIPEMAKIVIEIAKEISSELSLPSFKQAHK